MDPQQRLIFLKGIFADEMQIVGAEIKDFQILHFLHDSFVQFGDGIGAQIERHETSEEGLHEVISGIIVVVNFVVVTVVFGVVDKAKSTEVQTNVACWQILAMLVGRHGNSGFQTNAVVGHGADGRATAVVGRRHTVG